MFCNETIYTVGNFQVKILEKGGVDLRKILEMRIFIWKERKKARKKARKKDSQKETERTKVGKKKKERTGERERKGRSQKGQIK